MKYTPFLVLGLVLTACGGEEGTPTPVDLGPPPEELILPDMTGLDMELSIQNGLDLMLLADLQDPWSAHVETLKIAPEGCPDIYVGDLGELDLEDLEGGYAWMDRCRTTGGLGYSGTLGWQSALAVTGDPEEAAGQTTLAERHLIGDAVIDDLEGVLFEFDGEAQDAYYESIAPGYENWTYSSQVAGTITGRYAFGDSAYPGGWRQDVYLRYSKGVEDSIEVRGNIYLLDETMDRFDSVAADFTLQGQLGASPDECLLEPSGYISLRDPSAYWYEVVFQPLHGEDADFENPRSGCEGCGNLYVRGVLQGEICIDFTWIWQTLQAPDLSDILLTVR